MLKLSFVISQWIFSTETRIGARMAGRQVWCYQLVTCHILPFTNDQIFVGWCSFIELRDTSTPWKMQNSKYDFCIKNYNRTTAYNKHLCKCCHLHEMGGMRIIIFNWQNAIIKSTVRRNRKEPIFWFCNTLGATGSFQAVWRTTAEWSVWQMRRPMRSAGWLWAWQADAAQGLS